MYESNVRSYSRAFPRTFDRAVGAEIWDDQGARYLDFLAGCGALNYGHNNPALKEPLLDYISRDAITLGLDLNTTAKDQFLEAFHECVLAPSALDYVVQFTGPTGTNAVEAALKLARKVTGRSNIVSFTNGFHGVSIGALAVTGSEYNRNAAGMPLIGSTALPYDNYFGSSINTVDYFKKLLNDKSSGLDTPAAVIVETVQGEGGLNAACALWLQELQAVCKHWNILLIVDDIQAGCGRTGSFLSFTDYNIKPDIVTLSKSLSGYGLPMSVVLIERSFDQWQPGEHNGTFRGNSHAFVTATSALNNYWRTPDLKKEVDRKTNLLGQWLDVKLTQYPDQLLEKRGRGLMRGLVCADPTAAAAITSTAFDNGLIIERSGAEDEVIKFLTPLTIEDAQLQEGLSILDYALATVFRGDMNRSMYMAKPEGKAIHH
ncbi:MAG: diaminobutyrate-2-oxoglutarate transaminase [Granulosicoccus sp.]